VTEQELHKLGELLRAAREEKGVDLARVERDTKIRARYLSALEHGAYRELPGAVYTKGFLRNYGSYLGLDTEYLVDLYRLESAASAVERPTVQAPPRPITTRRSGAFVITPGAVLAALLTVGVALFIVYLVSEFVTFAGTPGLTITQPAGNVNGYRGDEFTFEGVTEPNATVIAETATRKTEVTADEDGNFEITVELRPGSNVITLVANDPLTGRDSDPSTRTILVGDGGSLAPSPRDELAVTSPEAGATFSAPVEVQGTGPSGATVVVTATPTAVAPAAFRITTLAGQDVPVPSELPAAPELTRITVGDDGTFADSLALAPATWSIAIGLEGGGGEAITREVVVGPPAGLAGTLRVDGSASYLEVDEDQVPKADVSGRIAQAGTDIALNAQRALRVRVGNAGAVTLTINGIELGTMGGSGAVVEWQITRL
jgi:cytoskeletal protein RodZ